MRTKFLFKTNKYNGKSIVFFDGFCHLCDNFVNILLKIDKKNTLFFSPLQGKTSKELEITSDDQELKTIIFFDGKKIYKRSTAVLLIFYKLGGIWSIFIIFKLIPLFIRDFIYKVIAESRYKIFGKRNSCRLAKENERKHFLP